jgi:hypothetical protein
MHNSLQTLRVVEDPRLPRNTMRAPLAVILEIKRTLGRCGIHFEIGDDEDVYFSNDLFAIFAHWQDGTGLAGPLNIGDWN